jgi:L-alanine-DL-glutamate epimerase-like enolase superfamily enzyme
MVERATKFSDHPILKMKVGFDGDVEAVGRIREVFNGKLRIDANEGWNEADAIDRLSQLERFNIELCEQPIPSKHFNELRAVRRSSPIPVFADEDVSDAHDVAQLAGIVDGVNLKLRKAGGIRELMKAAAVARAEGLQVMIGCDHDTGVAATAGAHIASLMDFVDLDGPLLLEKNPYPGITYSKGQMTLPEGPGIGVAGKP